MKHDFEREIYLDKKLASYGESDYYPFHMPGHKRQGFDFPTPYDIDITEIDGFDNLHHAKDILLDAQKRASTLYHTKETFYLINGSTCGILSAVSAALPRGGALLMARNCHKAVYHAAFLRQLKTFYLMPSETSFGIMGSIRPEDVSDALKHNPAINAVFLTSPTYDGVVSDISAIANIAHAYDIPLIVDEAHGAHFMFSGNFPDSALEHGADIVIHSVHKTLPCFTQTALLHVNSDLVSADAIRRFLGIYETSSPSYLLMASIEQGLRMMSEQGTKRMDDFTKLLKHFYTQVKKLKHLSVFTHDLCHSDTCFDWDFSKILISTEHTNLNGQMLYDMLRVNYHLQLEMASGHYVTALTSIMDTAEGFERLIVGLLEIDKNCSAKQTSRTCITSSKLYTLPEQRLPLTDAMEASSDTLLLKDAADCISQEYIYLYPPGIPLITPGEVITRELIDILELCKTQGLSVEGLADMENKNIQVIR